MSVIYLNFWTNISFRGWMLCFIIFGLFRKVHSTGSNVGITTWIQFSYLPNFLVVFFLFFFPHIFY